MHVPYSNLQEDYDDPPPVVNSSTQSTGFGEPDPNSISVKIRKLDASEYIIPIQLTSTVLQLKNKIQADHGDQANLQRLICHGRELEDSQILSQCNIENNSVIHLVMRQFVPEVHAPPQADLQNGNVPPLAINVQGQNNNTDISSFYVSRICRVIRSFAAINGFFFLILTVMTGSVLFLPAVMGCACGFYGAKYLRKCYLFIYVAWLALEIIFRIFIMTGGNMLLWFFTMIMICLDFYIMRHVLRLNRIISVLPPRQLDEILEYNQMQQRGLF